MRTGDGRSLEVIVDGALDGGPVTASVDGRDYVIDAVRLADGAWSLLTPAGGLEVRVRRDGPGWVASHDGGRLEAAVLDAGRAALLGGDVANDGASRALRAPMPGRIVQVLVAEGDTVEVGDGLVVVEAMKMENLLKAEAGGVVTHLHVAAGDAVEAGADLLMVEPAPAAGQ